MPTPLVKVNGSLVAAMPGTLSLQSQMGNRAALNVGIFSTDGTYRPEVGHTIEFFEAGTKIWAGSIDEVDETSIGEGNPTGREYGVRGVSWEQMLDKRYCYASGEPLRFSRNYEFTPDHTTDTLTTAVAHGRVNTDKVKVKCHANGALPAGLTSSAEYFVISATTFTLQLSLTSGGSAVAFSDNGTMEQILITMRAGEIVNGLLVAATSEPIGTTNIADGPVVDTVIWDSDTSIWEAITQLAVLANYGAWIDEEKELYYQPRTFTAAPFDIDTNSGNYRNIRARRTREDKVNSVLMRIDFDQIGYEEESFVGDGSTTEWALAFPVGQIVSMDVNGADQTFGIWLAESDRNYYFELGTEDIRQDPDDAVLTGAETLRVLYRKFGSNTIYVEDFGDVSATASLEGASGIYSLPVDRPGLGQVQAAADGAGIIEAKKANVTEIEYETDQNREPLCHTLRPGQLQTIENSYFNISSASYLIREVTVTDVAGQWMKFLVRAIDATRFIGSVDYWKAIAASAGGSSVVSGGGGGGTSLPGTTGSVLEIVLASNTTIASPLTPGVDDELTVFVTQGSGPYTIAWDAEFSPDTQTGIGAVNGMVTAYRFRGRADNLWYQTSSAHVIGL